MAKAAVSLSGRDILDLSSLSVEEYDLIMKTAAEMKKILKRDIKKVPSLRGKSIVNLFYENSTRTRSSFELAGDGCHAHPTQGLLDMFTILEKKKSFKGLKMAIIGDILYSRVARSNIAAWTKLGADVHVAGPVTLMPYEMEKLGVTVHKRVEEAIEGADVVDILRIQLERQQSGLFPTPREYARIFGVNEERMKLAKPDVMIMHPGPMNRGLEISYEVGYSDQAVIREQVTNGVAVRMALLFLTLTGGKQVENAD